ncbi:hypothetical protein [Streptomyces noursei]|uniref:hypothetical protein n=1 Tax=Streptomyces noursei TaxID=1971 RepID=UPI0030F17222
MPRSGSLPFGDSYDLDVRQLGLNALAPPTPRRAGALCARADSVPTPWPVKSLPGRGVVLHLAQAGP